MRGITRNGLFNARKSASDPNGRERHQDGGLIKRLETENLALRNQAAQLALQIQVLRHIGRIPGRVRAKPRPQTEIGPAGLPIRRHFRHHIAPTAEQTVLIPVSVRASVR
jgi:hypothetical protein